MKKLLFLCLALPLLAACSTDSNSKASTDEPVRLCCDGFCDTPEGYCCSETHCNGRCDSSWLLYTPEMREQAKADAEAAQADADAAK